MMYLLAVVLVALVLASRSAAWQILGQRSVVVNANQTLTSVQEVTFQCTASDYDVSRYFEIARPDGTKSNMTVVCTRPQIHYYSTLIGFTPRTGKLHAHSVCTARDAALNARPNSTQEFLNRVPSLSLQGPRRSLLGAGDDDVCESAGCILDGMTGGWFTKTGDGCGKKCEEIKRGLGDIFKAMSEKSDEATRVQQRITAQQAAINNAMLAWMRTQEEFDERLIGINKMLNDRVDTAIAEADMNDNATLAIIGAIDEDLIALYTRKNQTKLGYENLQRIVYGNLTELSASEEVMRDSMIHMAANLTEQIQSIMRDYRAMGSQIMDTSRKTARALSDSLGLIRRDLEMRDQRRALIKIVQKSLDESVDYDNYIVFLASTGTRGKYSEDMPWYIDIEQIGAYFLAGTGVDTLAYRQTYRFMCGVRHIMDATTTWSDWFSILSQLGPPGCSRDSNETSSCLCYVEYRVHHCAASQVYEQYNETVSSLVCNSGAQLIEDDARDLKSMAEFMDTVVYRSTLLGLTGTPLNESTTELFPTTVAALYLAQAVPTYPTDEERRRMSSNPNDTDARLSEKMADKYLNMDKIMWRDHVPGKISTSYAMMTYLIQAFSFVWNSVDSLTDFVDGTVPTDLTYRRDPYVRLSDGNDADCLRAYFVSYSAELEPIFRLDYATSQVGLVVDVDGIATTDYSVLFSNPLSQTLPNNYYVVGNPNGSVIYDVAQVDISMSPVPAAREGKVTYAMTPDAEGFNEPAWRDRNGGAAFDALGGSNFLSNYERPKEDGMCGGLQLAQAGGWCNLLTQYEVLDRETKDGVILYPRASTSSSTYVGTVTIPLGEIRALVFYDCPLITSPVELPSGKKFVFANTRADSATITFDVLVQGCGGSRNELYQDVTVLPHSAYEIWVPACTTTDKVVEVNVYRHEGSTQIACRENVDATTLRESVINSTGVPDSQYAKERVALVDSHTAEAIIQIALDLNSAAAELALMAIKNFQGIGLFFNESALAEQKRIIAERKAAAVQFVEVLANSTGYKSTYANYSARIRDITSTHVAADTVIQQQIEEQVNYTLQFMATRADVMEKLIVVMLNESAAREDLDALEAVFREGVVGLANSTLDGIRKLSDATKGCFGCVVGGAFMSGVGEFVDIGDKLQSGVLSAANAFPGALEDLGVDGLAALSQGAKALTRALELAVNEAYEKGKGMLEKSLGAFGKILSELLEILMGIFVLIFMFVGCCFLVARKATSGGGDKEVETEGYVNAYATEAEVRRLEKILSDVLARGSASTKGTR